MQCSKCQWINPESAQFCNQCGNRLVKDILRTSFDLSPASETTVLVDQDKQLPSGLDGERKIVTALFVDIKGYVALMINLDPEEAQEIIDPALKMMGDMIRSYNGYVVHTTGDGLFALFGAPAAYQDHPQRAVHASLAMQRLLGNYSKTLQSQSKPKIQFRIGI